MRRLVAGAVMTAAAGFVVPVLAAAPAQAAVCSGTTGVSVVVDFGSLGGGVRTACVADGGGDTAAENFVAAGFPLTQVTRQPGFVCRISGAPNSSTEKCVNTPPADKYWGLFIANGSGGGWSYATLGAYSLEVGDGEFVSFAFQSTNSRRNPGMAPVRPAEPTPKPTPTKPGTDPTNKPTKKPTTRPTTKESTGPGSTPDDDSSRGADPSAAGSPNDGRSEKPDETESDKASAKAARASDSAEPGAGDAGTDQTPGASSSDEPQEEIGSNEAAPAKDPDSVPTWLILLVILGLAGAAGVATVLRRRAGS